MRLKVYLVCVTQKGQVINLKHGLRKETLFPTKMESQYLSSGKKYLFIKIAFSFPARSNEDHTQNLPPAHDYQLFNHNQNILKNVNEVHWRTEMPLPAKPPREIPSVKLGLPRAIIKKIVNVWGPKYFPTENPQRDPKFVCSVANINTVTSTEKV